MAISCPKCNHKIGVERFNRPAAPCLVCGAEITVAAFASLVSGPADAGAGPRLMLDDQASCFYHPNKQASIPCENCGRFLCALCDVDFGGRHLCPTCIENGNTAKSDDTQDSDRILYDKLALFLAIIPLLITQAAALFLAIRYWTSPISIPPRSRLRWRWILTVVISLVEIYFIWGLVLSRLFREIFG